MKRCSSLATREMPVRKRRRVMPTRTAGTQKQGGNQCWRATGLVHCREDAEHSSCCEKQLGRSPNCQAVTVGRSNSSLTYVLKGNENTHPHKTLHTNNSTIPHRPKAETETSHIPPKTCAPVLYRSKMFYVESTQVCISRWRDEQYRVRACNGALPSYEKERSPGTHYTEKPQSIMLSERSPTQKVI